MLIYLGRVDHDVGVHGLPTPNEGIFLVNERRLIAI